MGFPVKIEEFIKSIKMNARFQHVYHFTDEQNIPCIRRHGLLSKKLLRAENLVCLRPGGNPESTAKDDDAGISDYVSLSFTPEHPMAYRCREDGRHPDQCVLGIDPEVLNIDGAMICLGVANSHDANLLSVSDAIPLLDVEVIYRRTDWKDPEVKSRLQQARKFELLIPKTVARDMIQKKWSWKFWQ